MLVQLGKALHYTKDRPTYIVLPNSSSRNSGSHADADLARKFGWNDVAAKFLARIK